MAKLLADYRTKLDQVLEDLAAVLDQPKKDAAIAEAVVWHSRHEPQRLLQDLAGNGSTREFAVASSFVEGFSVIRSIEYPQGQIPPEYMEREEYRLYRQPAGLVMQFNAAPGNGHTARVTYTGAHVVSAGTGTIADYRVDAVCNLAGMVACQWLANRFAQQGDSTIGADSVDHKSKTAEYAGRARDLKKMYLDALGIRDLAGPPAASVNEDWDQGYPWGEDRLTHRRRGWDA